MKFEQLRTFVAVLDHGGFSRAARVLGLSQSTVSFHVAALEETIGTRLLDRGRGRARSTAQGVRLEHYARRILAISEEAVRNIGEMDAEPGGALVVAVSTMVAEHFMPMILSEYRLRCPQVRVTLRVFDSQIAIEELRSERCDVAAVGLAATERRLESTTFAYDDIVLVGPTNGAKEFVQPGALAEVPLILREDGSGTRAAVADLLGNAVIHRPDVLHVGSTQTARRCVLEGLGYSFISKHAIAHDESAERLRIVAFPGTPVRRWFHAVRLRRRTPTPAAQAFHALLIDGEWHRVAGRG